MIDSNERAAFCLLDAFPARRDMDAVKRSGDPAHRRWCVSKHAEPRVCVCECVCVGVCAFLCVCVCVGMRGDIGLTVD